MISLLKYLLSSWAWKMAWQDCRAVRWRLLLFSTSIVFGVAALVTIGSLRKNLHEAVASQAKSLLGADLMVGSRQPYSNQTKAWFKTIEESGASKAREVSFTTMFHVPSRELPSLVNVRGLDASFPYYGKVVTEPADAWQRLHEEPGVIVEASFLQRINAEVGDVASLGDLELPILGVLVQAPPSASGFTALTPTAVTSLSTIEKTNLLGRKSLVFYRTYFKLPKTLSAESIVQTNGALLAKERLTQTTSKKRSENIEKAINRLYVFFNLIGFSALFLGGIGVAGAIHMHISERLKSVATLRCLGCSSARAFAVYLVQSIAMGAVGAALGLLVGCGLVFAISVVVQNLPAGILPFQVEVAPEWSELLKAGVVGLLISISFALLPLLAVRRVSPLAALRREQVVEQKSGRDPLRWLVVVGLVTVAFLLAWFDNQDVRHAWQTALGYVAFLVVAFCLLLLSGKVLRYLTQKIARPTWPFVLRQGIASLYRPNNQTGLFMVSIGLGVFLIFTLLLTQNILLQWISPERMEGKPNVFLIDVPPEETKKVEKIMSESGVTLTGNAPIIQMRLTGIKGRPVAELVKTNSAEKSGRKIPSWILRREFRSTYRQQLAETERITAGEWVAAVAHWGEGEGEVNAILPVSLEQKMAADLGVGIGDSLTVTIEGFGESIPLCVTSLREVDWRSMNLNFFMVFPEGALEPYVSYSVLAAHSPGDSHTAQLQKNIFRQYPYVNSIDVSLILKTVQSVLTTAGQTIQLMAVFTVITGALVLVASILAGRRIRIRESVLLRTLGASRRQISQILAVEYALLAVMATLSGALLALLASVLLGRFVFEGESYTMPWLLLLGSGAVVVSVTVSLGMLLSRGIAQQPPLQILRSEGR